MSNCYILNLSIKRHDSVPRKVYVLRRDTPSIFLQIDKLIDLNLDLNKDRTNQILTISKFDRQFEFNEKNVFSFLLYILQAEILRYKELTNLYLKDVIIHRHRRRRCRYHCHRHCPAREKMYFSFFQHNTMCLELIKIENY